MYNQCLHKHWNVLKSEHLVHFGPANWNEFQLELQVTPPNVFYISLHIMQKIFSCIHMYYTQ